jgi:FAD/FMN-containing dehydrogenase
MIGPMPFIEVQRMFDTAYPSGQRYYWKSDYVREVSDAALQAITTHAAARPSLLSGVDFHQMGGALSRVAADATAFGHRDAPFLVNTIAAWTEPEDDEANIAWARDLSAALAPYSTGTYVNFLSPSGTEAVRTAYEPGTYGRLAALKAKYDPTNVFRLNHNISPHS